MKCVLIVFILNNADNELSEGQFQNKNMLTIPPINPPSSCSIIKDQDLRQRDKTS